MLSYRDSCVMVCMSLTSNIDRMWISIMFTNVQIFGWNHILMSWTQLYYFSFFFPRNNSVSWGFFLFGLGCCFWCVVFVVVFVGLVFFSPREWEVRGKRARGRKFMGFCAWNRMAVCLCWIAFAQRYVSLQCFQPSVCVVWVQRDDLLLFPTRPKTSWRCYGKCQRKKHTEMGKDTVSNFAGDCTAIAPAWWKTNLASETQWQTPNTH